MVWMISCHTNIQAQEEQKKQLQHLPDTVPAVEKLQLYLFTRSGKPGDQQLTYENREAWQPWEIPG
ncbi:MAG: hypothetical protein LIP05_13945 [Tannerellaceae bacterium]|nr:hypothetical protein [Tannerellaceae bacterium]